MAKETSTFPWSSEREYVVHIMKGVKEFDKTIKEVLDSPEDKRKRIRRRLEDHLRKCQVKELAVIVALCGIKTEVADPK